LLLFVCYPSISCLCSDVAVDIWRDALETVINRRKLTDAQANPSTQRKRYVSPIWQITLYFTDKEQLYALLKIKEKKRILNQTHHMN